MKLSTENLNVNWLRRVALVVVAMSYRVALGAKTLGILGEKGVFRLVEDR